MSEREVWCPSCNGLEVTCDDCDGTGYVLVVDPLQGDHDWTEGA